MRNSNRGCRSDGERRRRSPEEDIAKIQTAVEEMTMHRYVHRLPDQACERGLLWEQLQELNRVLDYQNKILVELLASLDRLVQTVKGGVE